MYDPEKFDFDNIDEINIDDINVDDIDIEEIDSFDFEDMDIETNENHSFYNKDRQNTIHTYKEMDYLENEENEDNEDIEEIDVSNIGYNQNLDDLLNEYKSMDESQRDVSQEFIQLEKEPQQEAIQETVNSSNDFQKERKPIRRAIGRRNEQDNIQQAESNIKADYGTIPELESEMQQVDVTPAYNIETENINSIHKLESENIDTKNNIQDYNIDSRNINKAQENIRIEEEKREKKPEETLSEELKMKKIKIKS